MKQSKSVKIKTPAPRWPDNEKKQEYLTLCYDHPDQREFVFTIKGRPFSMLSTQKLPVPSTSLIDYNLVRDLGLKMEELQCSKFSYGGFKFRILGKISQTVQTIKDGVMNGTAHLRAAVVENLTATFDTHSIAGKKMTELLEKKVETNCSTEVRSEVRGSSPRSLGGSLPAASPSSPPTPAVTGSVGSTAPRCPKVSSPKPLNKHYTTTYHQPQRKEILGHGHIPARTLALKPDDQHFYGRVWHIHRLEGGGSEVTMTYRDGKNKSRSVLGLNTPYCHTINPFGALDDKLSAGDLVLVKEYGCLQEAHKDGHEDDFPILMVYNDAEESRLRALGVPLPDGPPGLHPGGYYG